MYFPSFFFPIYYTFLLLYIYLKKNNFFKIIKKNEKNGKIYKSQFENKNSHIYKKKKIKQPKLK